MVISAVRWSTICRFAAESEGRTMAFQPKSLVCSEVQPRASAVCSSGESASASENCALLSWMRSVLVPGDWIAATSAAPRSEPSSAALPG